MTLMQRLERGGMLLLDGAMGTELERRGVPMDKKAWSAVALDSHPQTVREIHEDYVRAGADVHIVHSFSINRQVLETVGREDKVEAFNRLAVTLCREAIEKAGDGRQQWLAGSVSNYAAGTDRSKLPKGARLRDNFAEQAGILQDAGVDLLALEMLSDVTISAAAIEAAFATGLPVMIGFTCDWGADGRTVVTRGHQMNLYDRPTPLDEILPEALAAVAEGAPGILAIMHCDLDVTGAALEVAKRHWRGPLAAYPNSGDFVPPNWQFDSVCTPAEFADSAEDWIAAGAVIVGGCCGIGPDHISALAQRLTAKLRG